MKASLIVTNLLAVSLLAASCQQAANKTADITKDTTAAAQKPELVNHSNAGEAYTSYLKVKDALVKSDSKAAKTAAVQLSSDLSAIDGCGPTATLANKIASTDKVDDQRKEFLILSKDMVTLVKAAKPKDFKAFVQYCPMANDGKGGYWLSANKEIENPYYGADMLECGEVKEEIK